MGHRANFVVIRDNAARAYCDQWAALGSTFVFASGPDIASATAEQSEPVAELMDWAFAEAGFLIDFDERQAIVFGYPTPLDDVLDDLDAADGLGEAVALDEALNRGPLDFLQLIAPQWPGWLLHWDERGVDAFTVHLARRRIDSIRTEPPTHPADVTTASLQA